MKNPDNGFEHTIRTNGVHAFVIFVKDKGNRITLSGWTHERWKWEVGQRVLVITDDNPGARYKITKIERPRDPPDQYFMDLKFIPRRTEL